MKDKLDFKEEFLKYEHIEEDFFDIDKELKIAHVKLNFEKPSDIFDVNYLSKLPVLSDDFLEWIDSAFQLIPLKYKIDLTVEFNDLEGWDEELLLEVFKKNIMLEHRTVKSREKRKKIIAYGLIGIGAVMFIAMILISRLWQVDSLLKDIFFYISDIATTVAFWEAMYILVVERGESGFHRKSLVYRFASIKFCKTENEKNSKCKSPKYDKFSKQTHA